MKCFIHNSVDAVRACTGCGKGMCVNCSAFNMHGSLCPACKINDLKQSAWKHFIKFCQYVAYQFILYATIYLLSQTVVPLLGESVLENYYKATTAFNIFAYILAIVCLVHFFSMLSDLAYIKTIKKSNKQGIKKI